MYLFVLLKRDEPGRSSCFGTPGRSYHYEARILEAQHEEALIEDYQNFMKKQLAAQNVIHLLPGTWEWLLNQDVSFLCHRTQAAQNEAYVTYERMFVKQEDNSLYVQILCCMEEDLVDFIYYFNEEIRLPARPEDFETFALESQEAYDAVYGCRCDEASWWKRGGLMMKYVDVPLANLNQELEQLMHDPGGSYRLRYFEET